MLRCIYVFLVAIFVFLSPSLWAAEGGGTGTLETIHEQIEPDVESGSLKQDKKDGYITVLYKYGRIAKDSVTGAVIMGKDGVIGAADIFYRMGKFAFNKATGRE